jgi:hypothetical protein
VPGLQAQDRSRPWVLAKLVSSYSDANPLQFKDQTDERFGRKDVFLGKGTILL